MTPTISASIKHSTPKMNIFKEPKSDFLKPGYTNSASRKSLSKNPYPRNVIPYDDVGTFIDDSCTAPYDPFTNYLAIRPRFRRYRPGRIQELVEDSDSSDSEISLNQEKDNCEEIVKDQENVVEDEEEEEDEIEEVFGEKNWGLKWVLLKWVFVISAVFLCSMCICNMKSDFNAFAMNSTAPIETLNFTAIRPEIKGLRLEVDDFDDLHFEFVSLSRLHSGIWVIRARVISDAGQAELNDTGVESAGNLSENDQMSDCTTEESIKCWNNVLKMKSQFRDADDSEHSEGSDVEKVDDSGSENGDLDSEHSEWSNVENVDDSESKNFDLYSEYSEGPHVEYVDDSESKKSNLGRNSANGAHEIGDGRIPESSSEAADMENDVSEAASESDNPANKPESVADIEQPKFEEKESVTVSVDVSEATSERENTEDKPELAAYNEQPKFDRRESETVPINPAINYDRQLKLDQRDVRFVYYLQLLAGLVFFGFFVRKFCCKLKKASSSIQASKVYHEESELPLSPSVSIPIEEERVEKNPLGRVIPMVKQVGELAFTFSLESSSVKSETSKSYESIYSSPVKIKALQTGSSLSGTSCSEASTADSQSHGSEVSSKKDRKREDSKVMSTPTRRSTRLRNKMVASLEALTPSKR